MENQPEKYISKRKDGEYKTPIYIRRAYKMYTKRIRENDPVKYQKMLDYQRQYYQKKKNQKELLEIGTKPQIEVV